MADVGASEARVFSVVSGIAAEELISSARVFSIYNYSAQGMSISAARTLLAVEGDNPVEISETRVFALVKGRAANPTLRAWTFTLDEHDFYVLRLGDAATLVYDVYSEQWTDWTGNGLPFWRPNVGMTWPGAQRLAHQYGSNTVAGDDTFGLLWFLDPNLPYDDQPNTDRVQRQVPIERIITGQVVVSGGRAVVPCFGIFLDGDNYGPAGITTYVATVRLETSDDQGRTFDDQGALEAVTDPAQERPYEWLSLGQITSPGRIFRITDTGIFTRIDSMSMNDDAG